MTRLYGQLQLVPPATPIMVRVSWWRRDADQLMAIGYVARAMRLYCRAAVAALGLSGSHGECPPAADTFEDVAS